MPSDMLRRLSDAYKRGYIDGQNCGQQQSFDGTMIYLHRNGWGAQRIIVMLCLWYAMERYERFICS